MQFFHSDRICGANRIVTLCVGVFEVSMVLQGAAERTPRFGRGIASGEERVQ